MRGFACALLLIWAGLAHPAAAQTISVRSGEHDGFTRLVLELPTPTDWQVGRTGDGYELRLDGPTPRFDLSEVFRLIGRNRLAAIWADPANGALRLGLACPCHAIPFELRPGVIVIDLRDGQPPRGSSFERSLEGAELTELETRPPPRPRPRPTASTAGYDWLDVARAAAGPPGASANPGPPPTNMDAADSAPVPDLSEPGLQPLREALLRQLSRGAAQGVIDIESPPTNLPVAGALPPNARITIGEAGGLIPPGLVAVAPGSEDAALTASGATCATDAQLNLASWGDGRPMIEQMSGATHGLSGEFDRPDAEAVLRATRLYLHIGFGAESRRLLQAFAIQVPDAELLTGLSWLVDGEQDPMGTFADMLACDTAAALWALLSRTDLDRGDKPAAGAVLRSFSALPPTMRRQLGPTVADRLLSVGEPSAADAVRGAVLRAPGAPGPQVELMLARLDGAAGQDDAAERRLEALVADPGPATSEALVALVEARVAAHQPVDANDLLVLGALAREYQGSDRANRYGTALLLAHASVGEFDIAFGVLPDHPGATADLWSLLASLGPDSAVLTYAVPAAMENLPLPARPVAGDVAARLLALGLADAALAWNNHSPQPDPLLAAAAHLTRRDARAALAILAPLDAKAAAPLNADALRLIGDEAAASRAFASIGLENERWRASARARDWPQIAAEGPDPWRAAAVALLEGGASDAAAPEPVTPPNEGADAEAPRLATGIAIPDETQDGPLARSRALAARSAAAGAAVEALLAAVARP